jgi:hypothetical protein
MVGFLISGCAEESPTENNDDPPAETGSWASVEIAGMSSTFEVLIFSGPGYDIARIPGFNGEGQPDDTPGWAREQDFVFEVDTEDAVELRQYFDEYLSSDPGDVNNIVGSITVPNLQDEESYRWSFWEFAPAEVYSAGENGRTRFTMECVIESHSSLGWNTGDGRDPFGDELSNNPATDTRVEISGGPYPFYPEVEVDESNRTITFTFDFVEGGGLFEWVSDIIEGESNLRSISIIQEESGSEVSRRNYYGCFPMNYEQITGYELDTSAKARVTVNFNIAQDVFR